MLKPDREARLQGAKAIGWIAYSHVRWTNIQANVPIEGEEKHFREFEDDGLAIELAAPFRPYARPDEFSRLRIRVHGEKVFGIRWDKAGGSRSSTTTRAIGSERRALGPRLAAPRILTIWILTFIDFKQIDQRATLHSRGYQPHCT
jgi:hypothetical protein